MPELITSNDNLALLSLSAAYEIDLRLEGSSSGDHTALRELGEQLTRAAGPTGELSTSFLYSDPSTTEVLAKALEEASDMAVTDIDGLASEMRKILGPIANSERDPSGDELQRIKAFCLALHRSMMAQAMPPIGEWDTVNAEFHFA